MDIFEKTKQLAEEAEKDYPCVAGVLFALAGSMAAREERLLYDHVCVYSEDYISRITEPKGSVN
ncbi:MAG: hypothetical protein ACYTFK_12935 [Planctomycetota bacterium]|jgi:hypothetical protein